MKPDNYTKAVLTLIALCLLVIAGKDVNFITTAHGAEMDRPSFVTVPLNDDGSMNVRVVGMPSEVDVNITGCSAYAFQFAELDVEVQNWP